MRIAYSYCGSGLGHKVPMEILMSYLTSKGHECKYFKPSKDLVINIHNNELISAEFVGENLSEEYFKNFESFSPEIVISDCEPMILELARKLKIKTLGVSSLFSLKNKASIKGTKFETYLNYIFNLCDLTFDPSFCGSMPPISRFKESAVGVKGLAFKYSSFLKNTESYSDSLKDCDYVISDGGQGFISDALILRKPIYCIPIKNHTPKEAFSKEVVRLGIGYEGNFEHFKDNLEVYRNNIKLLNIKPFDLSCIDKYISNTAQKMLTNQDVIDYVFSKRIKTHLKEWTRDQIALYVLEAIEEDRIRVYNDSSYLTGVVIFNPFLKGNFWIEQIWGDSKVVMKNFIKALQSEFPLTRFVYGHRHNLRTVKFSVKHLIKIYGS